MTKRRPSSFNQHGITLIELVVTIVILSISLVAVSFAINSGVSQSANTLYELRSAALAQAYLDEILSKKFDERSRNSGIPPCKDPTNGALTGRKCANPLAVEEGSRTAYDDVDDYNGLDEGLNSVGGDPLRDAQGNTRTGFDDFRVQVAVRLINVSGDESFPGVNAVTNPKPDDSYDAKLITVTVSDGSADGIKFSAYKSNF